MNSSITMTWCARSLEGTPAQCRGGPRPVLAADNAPAENKGPDLGEALELIVDTLEALTEERGGSEPIWGSMIKQAIKRRQPGFNERFYGFRSFNDMLRDAEKRGLLALRPDEKSGGYTVQYRQRARSSADPQRLGAIYMNGHCCSAIWSKDRRRCAARPRSPALELDALPAFSIHMDIYRRKSWMWAEACALLEQAERKHRHFFELLTRRAPSPACGSRRPIFSRMAPSARGGGACPAPAPMR